MTFGGTVGPSTEKPGQEADSGVMVSEVSERSTHTHTPPSVKYNTACQQDTAGRTGAQRAAGMAWRRGGGGGAQEGGQIGILRAVHGGVQQDLIALCKATVPQLKSKKKEVKGKTSRGCSITESSRRLPVWVGQMLFAPQVGRESGCYHLHLKA